jgi:hypothetical protein
MESNFRWKIYRQSQNDNVHILLASAELGLLPKWHPKKSFEMAEMLRSRRNFLRKKFVAMTITFVECTEKVQAWKLFSGKKLYLE